MVMSGRCRHSNVPNPTLGCHDTQNDLENIAIQVNNMEYLQGWFDLNHFSFVSSLCLVCNNFKVKHNGRDKIGLKSKSNRNTSNTGNLMKIKTRM